MAPGVYFRMLLLGYFEGIDSERDAWAWRTRFRSGVFGFSLTESTAGSLDDIAGAPTDAGGNSQSGVPLVRESAGGEGAGRQTVAIDATIAGTNAQCVR